MNCIIVEDQPPAQRILKKYIADIGNLNLIGTFSDAVQAMIFLKSEEVDLVFLDVHLPKISGIDFLKAIPNPPHIILTTAFSEYALEGYEYNIVDYLLKPFSFERFSKAIAKVQAIGTNQITQDKTETTNPAIFIKSGYEHIKIKVDDILYIKSDADYTEIFIVGKKHLSSESLRYWSENLNARQFVRIHKSYIINASRIEKIAGNQVFLSEGEIVPIGRVYKEEFINRFVNKS